MVLMFELLNCIIWETNISSVGSILSRVHQSLVVREKCISLLRVSDYSNLLKIIVNTSIVTMTCVAIIEATKLITTQVVVVNLFSINVLEMPLHQCFQKSITCLNYYVKVSYHFWMFQLFRKTTGRIFVLFVPVFIHSIIPGNFGVLRSRTFWNRTNILKKSRAYIRNKMCSCKNTSAPDIKFYTLSYVTL